MSNIKQAKSAATVSQPYVHTDPATGKSHQLFPDQLGLVRYNGQVVATWVRVAKRYLAAKPSASKSAKPAPAITGFGVVSLSDEGGERGANNFLGIIGRKVEGAPECIIQRLYVSPTGSYTKAKDATKENPTVILGEDRFGLGPGMTALRSREAVQEVIAALQQRLGDFPATATE